MRAAFGDSATINFSTLRNEIKELATTRTYAQATAPSVLNLIADSADSTDSNPLDRDQSPFWAFGSSQFGLESMESSKDTRLVTLRVSLNFLDIREFKYWITLNLLNLAL